MRLRHRRAHLVAWSLLAALVPVLVAAALSRGMPEQPPQRLTAPEARR